MRISIKNCMLLLLLLVVLPLRRCKAGTLCVSCTQNCIPFSSGHWVPLHAVDLHVLTLYFVGRGGPGRTFSFTPRTDIVGRMRRWRIVWLFSCCMRSGLPKCWWKCPRQFLRLRHGKINLLLRILLAESIASGVVWWIGCSIWAGKSKSMVRYVHLHLKLLHTKKEASYWAGSILSEPLLNNQEELFSSWYYQEGAVLTYSGRPGVSQWFFQLQLHHDYHCAWLHVRIRQSVHKSAHQKSSRRRVSTSIAYSEFSECRNAWQDPPELSTWCS